MRGIVAFLIALGIIGGLLGGAWYLSGQPRIGPLAPSASRPKATASVPSAIREIIDHPFWKKKLIQADLDRMIELAIHPGSRGIWIDANGQVADFYFLGGPPGSPKSFNDLDERCISVGLKPKTKAEAIAEMKALMDKTMADEKNRKSFEKKLRS